MVKVVLDPPTKSNMLHAPQQFLSDRFGCSIFPGQKLTNRKNVYNVIKDHDLGLCIEDKKTGTLEMLTVDIAKNLELVDERIYA